MMKESDMLSILQICNPIIEEIISETFFCLSWKQDGPA